MKTQKIKQVIIFKANAHNVFEALIDSKKHSEFTGGVAKISRKIDGKISAYDGYIEGKNIEVVKEKRIGQEWRAVDWPENHFSRAIFSLEKIKGGTKLTFTQTGVPEKFAKAIIEGWHEHYWEPMKKMLES